jgi:hypothetical protein
MIHFKPQISIVPILVIRNWSLDIVWILACLRDLPTPAEALASRRQEPLRRRQVLGNWCLSSGAWKLVLAWNDQSAKRKQ